MTTRENLFVRNQQEGGHWRWFVDPFWYHCSWMYQEAHYAEVAQNKYERHRHVSGCLYFAVGMVEVLLNNIKRSDMTAAGKNEEEILKGLRFSGNFYEKTREPFGDSIPDVVKPIRDRLLDLNEIRAEVTHPKFKDHSLFRELDNTHGLVVVEIATEYIAAVHERCGKAFPYWLLGWNQVGANNDPAEPVPLNVGQFLWALKCMGHNVPTVDYYKIQEWERENMMTLSGFRKLRGMLANEKCDIQPINPALPMAPRLTRRWWDRKFLLEH